MTEYILMNILAYNEEIKQLWKRPQFKDYTLKSIYNVAHKIESRLRNRKKIYKHNTKCVYVFEFYFVMTKI